MFINSPRREVWAGVMSNPGQDGDSGRAALCTLLLLLSARRHAPRADPRLRVCVPLVDFRGESRSIGRGLAGRQWEKKGELLSSFPHWATGFTLAEGSGHSTEGPRTGTLKGALGLLPPAHAHHCQGLSQGPHSPGISGLPCPARECTCHRAQWACARHPKSSEGCGGWAWPASAARTVSVLVFYVCVSALASLHIK